MTAGVATSPEISTVVADVGPRLKRVRTQRDVTLTELAAATGISKSTLSRLESGGATPTVPLLARLAAALNADLDITFRPHTPVAA